MKTYTVEYECHNCGTMMKIEVEKGKSIPVFTNKEPSEMDKSWGLFFSPECEYCGCRSFRLGRKSKGGK